MIVLDLGASPARRADGRPGRWAGSWPARPPLVRGRRRRPLRASRSSRPGPSDPLQRADRRSRSPRMPSITSTTRRPAAGDGPVVPAVGRARPGCIDAFAERDLVADFKLDLDSGPRPALPDDHRRARASTATAGRRCSSSRSTTNQVAVYKLSSSRRSGRVTQPSFELVEIRSAHPDADPGRDLSRCRRRLRGW